MEQLTQIQTSQSEAEKYKRIRINFCVLGEQFSWRFLRCWTNTLIWVKNTNLDIWMYNAQASNVYHGREMLLLGDLHGDENQKPFKGEPYDYILFVDSDQVWEPSDIDLLLKANKEVIGGCIKMSDGNYAQGYYNPETFKNTKYTYRLVDDFINASHHPFEVTLLGCGFTLVKYGVIEKIKFPWFKPIDYPAPLCGYLGEDMSLFTRIMNSGTKLWIHPLCRIGHEKSVVLK